MLLATAVALFEGNGVTKRGVRLCLAQDVELRGRITQAEGFVLLLGISQLPEEDAMDPALM